MSELKYYLSFPKHKFIHSKYSRIHLFCQIHNILNYTRAYIYIYTYIHTYMYIHTRTHQNIVVNIMSKFSYQLFLDFLSNPHKSEIKSHVAT